jgi:predicted Zn-dependent protease
MKTRLVPLLVLALIAAGCDNQPEVERVTIGDATEEPTSRLAPELQAPIDAGNAAYRARDYEAALRHYQDATRAAPGEATGWFGVAMAAEALGDAATAEQARAEIAKLAPDLSVAGHTQATDNGHPTTDGAPPIPGHP